MPAVSLSFHFHQPFRLRKYTVFDSDTAYFDTRLNATLLKQAAETAYLPLLRLLHSLLLPRAGPDIPDPPTLRVALALSGTLVEQLEIHAPEVLHALHALAASPHVEFLAQPYHQSLASLRSPGEFIEQVNLHRQLLKRLFNAAPTVLINTDLLYSNEIAQLAADLHFSAVLVEGYEPALNNRSAAFPYAARLPAGSPGKAPMLLLRNHHLSELLAAPEGGLPAVDAFAHMIANIGGPLCNLVLPAEIAATGPATNTAFLTLLGQLPPLLAHLNCPFVLPSLAAHPARPRDADESSTPHTAGDLDVPAPISALAPGRDLSAWLGNAMQQNAHEELYKLHAPLAALANAKPLADWRKLTSADHLAFMSTRDPHHASPHNPYESPYDAYINFMNILDNIRTRTG